MTLRVSRRQFVACAAAAAVPLRWQVGGLLATVPATRERVILDLGAHCSLPESLSGYAAALGKHVLRTNLPSAQSCGVMIVPAAVVIAPRVVRGIAGCLDAGGLVILESGAGFASAGDFSRHRTILREAFGVYVEPPVDLWPQPNRSSIPYVDFSWPSPMKVRDFSRVVPLANGGEEIVGRIDDQPVALRRSSGRGTLIILGSPLGPALWAGDSEARRWIQVVIEATPGWGAGPLDAGALDPDHAFGSNAGRGR